MKTISKIFLISMIIFLSLDFFFGAKFINFFFNGSKPVVKNLIYDHDLDKNLNKSQIYNNSNRYQLCTNSYGLRSSCKKEKTSKIVDYAFIGDSFTEGVGLDYEDTFVGLFQNEKKDKQVLNFGVESYSPKIYYSKIKHYLDNGFTFKRLIVFVDIGDVYDENKYIFLENKFEVLDRYNFNKFLYKNFDFVYRVKKYLRAFFPLNYILYAKFVKIYKNKILENKNNNEKKEDVLEDNLLINSRWTYNNKFSENDKIWIENGKKNSLFYMSKLAELTEKNNIKLTIAVYPWPAQILHDKNTALKSYGDMWKKFCKQKCEHFINILEDYDNLKNKFKKEEIVKTYFLLDDVHFNKEGNYLIFKKLKNIFN